MNRVGDLACCVLSAPVLLPLFALIALAIRLDDGGPVLFRQERLGLHRSRFLIFKFRTMRDQQVTRSGAWLRRTGLDETAQVLNVLRGEMSWIGPRPLTEADVQRLGWTGRQHDPRFRIRPGMTGAQIDREAEEVIRDLKAVPGFKGYRGFPATLCVSPNNAVVHGIPSDHEFQDGDVVSVDCGAYLNGYFGDSAYTFALGEVTEPVMDLLRVTNTSLYLAIDQAVAGKRLGDIGFAVQEYVERRHKYGVVRELVGHGIGKNLHEEPEVPNYGKRGRGPMLKEGLVIAIEPMINMGRKEVRTLPDDWTIVTKDRKPSAHYEHTIAVTHDGPDILSNHEIVVEAIQRNPNVQPIVRETVA